MEGAGAAEVVAADAALGARDLFLAGTLRKSALTVYEKVDFITITKTNCAKRLDYYQGLLLTLLLFKVGPLAPAVAPAPAVPPAPPGQPAARPACPPWTVAGTQLWPFAAVPPP